MLRSLLIWGLVAGLCGGLAAAGFAVLVGEPAIDMAVAFEQRQAEAQGEPAEVPLVLRGVQKSAGLLVAAAVYGGAMGGLFALTFVFAYGRVGRTSPRLTVYWLAAAAFAVVFLVPFVKYPAKPPSAGDPATIGSRTELYAAMLGISILAAIAAARLRPALARRFDSARATLLALGYFLALVVSAGSRCLRCTKSRAISPPPRCGASARPRSACRSCCGPRSHWSSPRPFSEC